MLRLVFPLVWLTASAAFSCPQSFDTDHGMRLTSTNPPSTEVFRRTPDGLTQHRVTLIDGTKDEASYLYPHPLIVGERVAGGVTLGFRYDGEIPWLDDLPIRKEWRAQVTLRRDGKIMAKGRDTVTFLGLDGIRIGDCAYGIWRVEEVMELEGMAPIILEKHYSPQLGLVLLVAQKTESGDVTSVATFDTIDIATGD